MAQQDPGPAGEMVTRVIATTHEISLKGGNRMWFERQLNANVRWALADLPLADLRRPSWRLMVSFAEPVPYAEVARRLATVFGLNSFMPVEHGGHTVEEAIALIDSYLGRLSTESFAVRCLRSDKSFPLTSTEIERRVGEAVVQRTGWKVNLGSPQLTIHMLVDINGIWVWFKAIKGPGGLPVGTGGRAVCLLSGGIDSPVAAYLMMKRGMRLDFIHFHSVPRTDMASLEKVQDIVQILNRYQHRCRLAMVPLLPAQEQVVALCPPELRVLLYRRLMLRMALRLAARFKARALVTGESLGQVASQTLENLGAVEAIATQPLLRPLIGLDKQEIIALARRAGTYETSIQPHGDCCSLLMPPHPATRAKVKDLDQAEALLPVEELVANALDSTEITTEDEAADWAEMPLPPGMEG